MKKEKIVSSIVVNVFRQKGDWKRKGLRWARRTAESDLLFHLLPSKIVGSNIRPQYYPEIYVSYHRFRTSGVDPSDNLFHEDDQYQVSLRLTSFRIYQQKLEPNGFEKDDFNSFYDENVRIDHLMRENIIENEFNDLFFCLFDNLSNLQSMIDLYAEAKIPVYSLMYLGFDKWVELLSVNKKAVSRYMDWMATARSAV